MDKMLNWCLDLRFSTQMNRVQKGFWSCLIKMVSFHVLLIRVALALPCEINLDVNTTIGSAEKRKKKNIKRILNKS